MTEENADLEKDPVEKEEVLPVEEITVPKEEWNKLQQEVEEHKNRYLMLLADMENLRKRLQKEKSDMLTYAKESLICEFLHPMDHFAKALGFKEGLSQEVKNWMVGFEMILSQFKDVLAQNEVRQFDSIGNAFDPLRHEAVEMKETDEYPPGTVIQEYMKGYAMGDRVIRPARVQVSKPISNDTTN